MRHRNRNGLRAAALLVAASLGIAACATTRIGSDYDRSIDFSRYRTYDWVDVPVKAVGHPEEQSAVHAAIAKNSLLDKRVRRQVEAELRELGLVRVEDRSPDLLLRYYVTFRDRTSVHASSDPFPRRFGTFGGRTTLSVRDFQEGTLVLDVIDPERNELVWRGWGVARTRDLHYGEEELRVALERMLGRFPTS